MHKSKVEQYDVFVSYHRSDSAAVQMVADALRQQGLRVFLDRWYLVPGRPWPRVLEDSLTSCGAVAAFVGPHGLGEWQKRELELALERQSRDPSFPVIPVILPDADPPLGWLVLNTWVDLRDGIEGQDGLALLYAGIKGEAPGPALKSLRETTIKAICPYRGLRHFREEDAAFYFGRKEFAERIADTLSRRQVVAVVGASGSGKSSAVLAGLVPRLRAADQERVWDIVTLVPGEHPLRALSAAMLPRLESELSEIARLRAARELARDLASGSTPLIDVVSRVLDKQPGSDSLLVIVDQWEELYTLCRHKQNRTRFIDELLDSVGESLSLVFTLRADFYGEAVSYRPLADRLQDTVINLGPMTRTEMEQAVVAPAEKVGLSFEPGLVDKLVDDVEEQPGNLPLLEFVLSELWQKRRGDVLVHAAYEEMGEIQGAIARRAEAVYGQLSPENQRVLRNVLLQLIRPGESAADTRRRATFSEIGQSARPIVQKMADARLLVTGRDQATGEETVEVAHEALIRNWERLQAWLEHDRTFLLWRERLRQARVQWERMQLDKGALLRGAALRVARGWLAERPADLSGEDRNFINESQRVEFRQRTRRRLGILVVSVAVLAIPVVVWSRIRTASEERQVRAIRLLTDANRLFDSDPLLAAQLMAELPTDLEPPGGVIAARRFLDDVVLPVAVLEGHRDRVETAEFSPAGSHILTASLDSTARVWRVDRRGDPLILKHAAPIACAAFDASGRRVVTGGMDGSARIWSLDQLDRQLPLEGHDGPVLSAAFSPDGSSVATASADRSVRVWRVGRGFVSDVRVLAGHDDGVVSVAFSRDGSRLVSASFDGTARVWSLEEESEPTVLRHTGMLLGAVFSDDGSRVLTYSDHGARVWLLGEPGRSFSLGDPAQPVMMAEFDPHGDRVIIASDSTASIWPSSGGEPIEILHGQRGSMHGVAYSPDGSRIVTASEDGTAWVRCLERECEPLVLSGHSGAVWRSEFSPDGTLLLTRSADRTVRVWRVARRREPVVIRSENWKILSATASPDASVVIAGLEHGHILTWKTADATPAAGVVLAGSGAAFPPVPKTFLAHDGDIMDVSLSRDGRRALTASADRTARVWNLDGWREHTALLDHNASVSAAAFSLDGSVVTTSADGAARIWRPDDGVALVHASISISGAAFSPDGSRVLTYSADGPVQVRRTDDPDEILFQATHRAAVLSASFSPDGLQVLSASQDSTAILWNIAGADDPIVLPHDEQVQVTAFSDDGSHFTTGAKDGTVRIWERGGKGVPVILRAHGGAVTAAEFSPDGKRLVTASTDGTARVWRIDGKGEPTTLRGHEGPVYDAFFGDDGNRVVTVTTDAVRIWRVGWQALLEYFTTLTAECLNPVERVQYLAEKPEEAREAFGACERRHGRSPVADEGTAE